MLAVKAPLAARRSQRAAEQHEPKCPRCPRRMQGKSCAPEGESFEITCDTLDCGRRIAASDPRFTCYRCDYDLCARCAGASACAEAGAALGGGESNRVSATKPGRLAAKKAPAAAAKPTAGGKRSSLELGPDGVPIGNVSDKFFPIARLRAPVCQPRLEDGKVPKGASILIVQQPWIGLLLSGQKTLEIRGKPCSKPAGERVYLALSGGGGIVLGSVAFVACHGPLGTPEWARRAPEHCVEAAKLPYPTTYAWEVGAPVRFHKPVPYHHKPGVVVWAVM